ncbi:MAG: AI-2E family transporter [Bacilli bacterium]|nr:AI-2E family transporter [Bacilli bacterium]
MFNKKKKLGEVIDLSSKVLKVLYLLLIALGVYIVVIIFKETKILYILKTIIKVVSPLFIGLLIAWLFDPFVKWLEKKKIKRFWGSVITYVLIFLCLFLVIYSLVPLLIDQTQDFIKTVPEVVDEVKDWASDVFKHLSKMGLDGVKMKSQFMTYVNDITSNITTTMPKNFIGFVSKMISYIGTFILGLIIGFFLIVNFDSSSKLFNFIPKKYRKETVNILDKVNISLRSYVRGAIIDCTIIFILSSIGLWICGLKAPVLFGLFCGLTNIIPYAGPYIGGAPAVLVGFTQDPLIGIFCLIVIFVIQFLEGNFLQPYIMSKTTKLHPVTIILGLLLFGHFFGIIGMLISTPIIASVKTILMFWNDKYKIIKENSHEQA